MPFAQTSRRLRAVAYTTGKAFQLADYFSNLLGQSVHQPALHAALDGRDGEGLHGRSRTMDGQRDDRTAMAVAEVWKCECVYLHAFETGSAARAGIGKWMTFYNTERPHSALGGRTPIEAHQGPGLKAVA